MRIAERKSDIRGFNSNKKGIISLEILISLFIVVITVSLIYIKYRNINEQRDIERAVDIFESVVYKYTSKSMLTGKTYDFKIDYKNKVIEVYTFQNEKSERIELPKKIEYATPYDKIILKKIDFSTTSSGNLSKSFSVYIFNYSDEAVYRVAYYSFQQSRILKINTYKNISAGKIKYEDILKYHYEEDEEKTRKGWQKQ